MISGASNPVNAAFMRNHRGAVCIAFSDPAYVRAETITVDRQSGAIHAIVHESAHLLGHVSDMMVEAFAASTEALLTSLRADGSILELTAPVRISG